MDVDLMPILIGQRFQHNPENIPDDEIKILYKLMPRSKAVKIVNYLLDHPRSFDEGNIGREQILFEFRRYFGYFDESADDNKLLLLINAALRWYNKYVLDNLLFNDLIGKEDDNPNAIMQTVPILKYNHLRQLFVDHCNISFFSVKKLLDNYEIIAKKWPKAMGGYFENFGHFCLYIIEHEFAHALNARIQSHLTANDLHNKMFWTILSCFAGQNVPHSLAHMYYYDKNDIDNIAMSGENPVYSNHYFKKIARDIGVIGMSSVRDREMLAQEIFNAVIAIREAHV